MVAATEQPPGRWRAAHRVAAWLLVASCARFGYELLPGLDLPPDAPLGMAGGGSVLASGGGAAAEAGAAAGTGGVAATFDAAGAAGSSCFDGVQSAGEAAVDCGGPSCPPCPCAFSTPELLGEPNYAGNSLYSPTLSPDGLELWFGLVIPGLAEQVGRATRSDPGSAFGLGEVVAAPLSTSVEGNPHLSADGLSLYFYSERSGTGAQELYLAARDDTTDDFGTPQALVALNSAGLDQVPWLSPDGLSLYFVSDRSGNRDVWRATRADTSQPLAAAEPVSELNSSSPEGKATLTPDGRQVIFSSDRPGGPGGTNLYLATRARTDVPFAAPLLLEALSSDDAEYDAEWTRDGQWVYFASRRGSADSRLWRAAASCP